MNLRIVLLLFLFAPILLSGGDLKGAVAAKREIDAARAGSLAETGVDTLAAELQKYRNLAESEIEKIEEEQKEDLAKLNRRYAKGLENVKVALPFADLLFLAQSKINPVPYFGGGSFFGFSFGGGAGAAGGFEARNTRIRGTSGGTISKATSVSPLASCGARAVRNMSSV